MGCIWVCAVKFVDFGFKRFRYPMDIGVICDFNTAMAQLITYISHVMASEKPYCRKGMPEVMCTDSAPFCVFQATV